MYGDAVCGEVVCVGGNLRTGLGNCDDAVRCGGIGVDRKAVGMFGRGGGTGTVLW